MFLFKKLVSQFLFPLTLALAIALAGLVMLWHGKRPKAAKLLLTTGLALLLIIGYPCIGDPALRSIERTHPPFDNTRHPAVGFVVVLGSGSTTDPDLPTSQIGKGSLTRLVEGIRIQRLYPGSRLILSGGSSYDPTPVAKAMADVALLLGVAPTDIILEDKSKDTKDEARLLKPMVGQAPFALVTSAAHMPRSMALFRKLGMQPIPAPTAHRVKQRKDGSLHPGAFFPSPDAISRLHNAVYEYLGLAWAWLRGQT